MRYIILLPLLLLVACGKDSAPPPAISDAVYTGTFQRKLADGTGEISAAGISFYSGKSFSGAEATASELAVYYPCVCGGDYRLEGTDSIRFFNRCYFLPEFDLTLLLDGKYKFQSSEEGKRLTITRRNGNLYEDIYVLTRKD